MTLVIVGVAFFLGHPVCQDVNVSVVSEKANPVSKFV